MGHRLSALGKCDGNRPVNFLAEAQGEEVGRSGEDECHVEAGRRARAWIGPLVSFLELLRQKNNLQTGKQRAALQCSPPHASSPDPTSPERRR